MERAATISPNYAPPPFPWKQGQAPASARLCGVGGHADHGSHSWKTTNLLLISGERVGSETAVEILRSITFAGQAVYTIHRVKSPTH